VFQRGISRLRFAHKEGLNGWQFNGLWSDSQTFGGIRPALCARLPARGLPPHPYGASGTCSPWAPAEIPCPLGTRRQAL